MLHIAALLQLRIIRNKANLIELMQ